MEKLKIACLFLLISTTVAQAQSVLGKWKIMNEDTGEVRSVIKIFKDQQGEVSGKVLKIMDPEDRDNLCVKCEGENKNKKIQGMTLLEGFEKEEDGTRYVNGTITNPDNGKIYDSKIWVDEDNPNILDVRGYIGIFYKTMQWQRLN